MITVIVTYFDYKNIKNIKYDKKTDKYEQLL